jgi:hypothetical protein
MNKENELKKKVYLGLAYQTGNSASLVTCAGPFGTDISIRTEKYGSYYNFWF